MRLLHAVSNGFVNVCVGTGLWRLLGTKLPEGAKTLIEERLKYTDRELARKGLRPGYKAAGDIHLEAGGIGGGGGGYAAASASSRPASAAIPHMAGPPSPRIPSSPSTKAGRPPSPAAGRPPSPGGVRRSSASPVPQTTAAPRGGGHAGGSILTGVAQPQQRASGIPSPSKAPAAGAGTYGYGYAPDGASNGGAATSMSFLRGSSANWSAGGVAVGVGGMGTPDVSGGGVAAGGLTLQSLNKAGEKELRGDMELCIRLLQSEWFKWGWGALSVFVCSCTTTPPPGYNIGDMWLQFVS